MSIAVTDVVEHAFCPKFTYFQHVLGIPQHEQRRETVQTGRTLHKTREYNNPTYVPRRISEGKKIVAQKMYSKKLDLIGKIDSAIVTKDNAILYEYKYSRPFIGPTLRVQLGLLALLLEENLNLPCNEARVQFLSNDRIEETIPLTSELKEDALQQLCSFRKVMNEGTMPFSNYGRRCEDCCYKNICPVGSLKTSQ